MLPYILLGLIVALFTTIVILIRRSHAKALTKAVSEAYSAGGKNAVEVSRRVIKGKVSEEIFPLMSGCPYVASDMKFMGMPIDYLIFDGLSDVKDAKGEINKIYFADIKTGNASLSLAQRKIRDAVAEGRVGWVTIQMTDDGTISIKEFVPKKSTEAPVET